MDKKFEVEFLLEVSEFLNNLDQKSREKIYYNVRKAQSINDSELFKKLTDNVWEFRTLYNGTAFRLFAFWDKNSKSLVVATHGIEKKAQKTPHKEIEKTENIRNEYLIQKYGSNKK